jgi:hypothetical protein
MVTFRMQAVFTPHFIIIMTPLYMYCTGVALTTVTQIYKIGIHFSLAN